MVTNIPLCRLVLDWIKRQLSEETLSMMHLLERTHLLYLALDNSLQDCSDLPAGHESESDLVQDYKKLVLKCPNNKSRRKQLGQPVRPRVLIYSRDIGERETSIEPDWNVIGSTNVSENTFVALVTLNGQLTRISIQLRLNVPPTTTPSPVHVPESLSLCPQSIESDIGSNNGGGSGGMNSGNGSVADSDEHLPETFCEVAPMSGPKCGLGVADWNGKLLVCGGYDRGDCLKCVESYDPVENQWTQEPKMLEARGRVQIAVLNGDIYAVGGSNGKFVLIQVRLRIGDRLFLRSVFLQKACLVSLIECVRGRIFYCAQLRFKWIGVNIFFFCFGSIIGTTELDTVERLCISSTKWQKRCKLPMARSNAGVCALNGRVYCIGGWNGQIGIKQCDVYNPEENVWTSIAPLLTGRYQAGVVAFKNKLWAAGGSDAWNCLGSAETYDPETDQWTSVPSLLTPRRGCGLAVFNGKLYAVGGSDGTHSLSSTEIFDEETKTWIVGPNLTASRANVSCVAVDGKLYAVGGFAGKHFLNTMEYLDLNTNEWTTFVPQSASACASINGDEEFSASEITVIPNGKPLRNQTNGHNTTNGASSCNGTHNGNGHSEPIERMPRKLANIDEVTDDRKNVIDTLTEAGSL